MRKYVVADDIGSANPVVTMMPSIQCILYTELNYSHHPPIGFTLHYEAKWVRLVFSGIEDILGISFALRDTAGELNFIPLREWVLQLEGKQMSVQLYISTP